MMHKKNRSIAVVIPCYNEELTIATVIKDFQQELPEAFIVVCDNNSTDKTSEIATQHGATVLRETKQGKANAVLKLFEKVEADIYIMVDGDATYPADQAKELVRRMEANELDMVVGDRLSNKSYFNENKRAFHSFGNQLTRNLINRFFRSDLKDILSGYRVFSKRFVKNYITLVSGFELETDLTIFCLNYNLAIEEVPIQYTDRPENSFSKLNTYTDGIKVIKTIFNLYRLYKPLSFFTWISLVIFLAALIIGSFPVYEYVKFEYVYRVPTFILSVIMALVSILLFTTGLTLDSLMKQDRKAVIMKFRRSNNDFLLHDYLKELTDKLDKE